MRAQAKLLDRAIEVVVMWGQESVLHVAHLWPPRSFGIGEGADYLIGAGSLGFALWPVVVHEEGDSRVVLPAGASFEVVQDGALVPHEALSPRESSQLHGARELTLSRDLWVRVTHRDFSVIVRELPAEPFAVAAAVVSLDDVKAQKWTAASAAAHLLLVLGFYFLPPASTACSIDLLNTDSRLVKYVIEKRQEPDDPSFLKPQQDHDAGKDGRAAEGEVGKIGKPHPKRPCSDCKAQAAPNPNPQLTREDMKALAMQAGIVGFLRATANGMQASASPYAAANALHGPNREEMLAMLGTEIGEAESAFGGLGPHGTGHGGGGDGHGTVGVGDLGTIGGRRGTGNGPGYGDGADGALRGHHGIAPGPVRLGKPAIMGGLSKEVIRRTIGRHVAEVRACYMQALNAHPELQGRVVVQFWISPSGAVMKSLVKESDLGDPAVARCIAEVIGRTDFPAPDGGGLVTVSYPFVLQQVGD